MTKCLQQKIWNSLGLKMCSLSCNLISYGHIWTNGGGGGKKSNFVLLQPCQWRMNSDPQVQQHNFIFRCTIIQFQQTPPRPARHLTECNSLLTLTSQNAKEKKWAAESQRKKSNLFFRIKMGWVLGLTFLLSSISCSNMALNTGERAESSNIGGNITTAAKIPDNKATL